MSHKAKHWRLLLGVFGILLLLSAYSPSWATTCADCQREVLDPFGSGGYNCKCHVSCSTEKTCTMCCEGHWGITSPGGYDNESKKAKKLQMKNCKGKCKGLGG